MAAEATARGAAANRLSALDLFAVTAPGLAELARRELVALGITSSDATPDGLGFTGDVTAVMRTNLWLRTASRVLVRMGSFRARAFAELERDAARLPWRRFVAQGERAAFRVTARKCRLYHTAAITERLARVAGVEVASAARDEESDAQLFVVRGVRDEWTISADSSGTHLHRRGYRLATAKAPLRETLAAAMVLASEWDMAAPLVDPFCGSGTIPIEAALLRDGIAPGLRREFSFMNWPDFDDRAWRELRAHAARGVRGGGPGDGGSRGEASRNPGDNETTDARIAGYDRDTGAVDAALANAERAGIADMVQFASRAISAFEPPAPRGWLVCNPPYGVRVGERSELRNLYARFGSIVRERCAGWLVGFLSADPMLERATRLDLQPVLHTTNGGLRVRFMLTEVH